MLLPWLTACCCCCRLQASIHNQLASDRHDGDGGYTLSTQPRSLCNTDPNSHRQQQQTLWSKLVPFSPCDLTTPIRASFDMTITAPLTASSSSPSTAPSATASSSSSSSYDSSNFDLINSYQNRNQNAIQRRHQQLLRWREIEQNEANPAKPRSQTKVCFSPTTLFLSACAQNDIDECERLLKLRELRDEGGVNVTNCDGLTALHQACIDDNDTMVQWLLVHNADINCKDNEGWTPLHASAR